jgi:galactoside O-acetyltransferase
MSAAELRNIGFKSIGINVNISKKISIYNPEFISIGNNVRVDDFCILSASNNGITIGNYVHITAYVVIAGGESILLEDFTAIGAHSCIYSSNDDYSGGSMTNSMIDTIYKKVHMAAVLIKKHTIIGSHTTILPGVTIGEGVAVGSHSLVKSDLNSFGIYCGVPAVFLKKRKKKLLVLEKTFSTKNKRINSGNRINL